MTADGRLRGGRQPTTLSGDAASTATRSARRLYLAETPLPSSPLPGLDACARFVDRVVGLDVVARAVPRPRTSRSCRVSGPGNGARQAFYREEETGPTITLPRRYRTKGVVLHELVHFALGLDSGLPHHGRTFARVLLDATDEFCGAERARTLADVVPRARRARRRAAARRARRTACATAGTSASGSGRGTAPARRLHHARRRTRARAPARFEGYERGSSIVRLSTRRRHDHARRRPRRCGTSPMHDGNPARDRRRVPRQPRHRGRRSSSRSPSPGRRRCSRRRSTRSPTPGTRGCCSSAAVAAGARRRASIPSASAPSATSGRSSSRSCCSRSARCSRSSKASTSSSIPSTSTSPIVAYVVLGVAIVLEALSLRTARREALPDARTGRRGGSFIHTTKNAELPVVLLEDTGALVGLFIALVGITPRRGHRRPPVGRGRQPRRSACCSASSRSCSRSR